jgi:3-deoxy-D-manno-octulosonic-acid transferase
MKLFYSLSVQLYVFAIHLSSLWNSKAKKWVSGRKDVWQKIEAFKRDDELSLYWFHCASLGEYEQGRPVIEALKEKENCQIIITFFSPSGYEIRKNYEVADLIVYLPKDSASNAKRFLDHFKPQAVFFVKYEFWANYLFESKRVGAKLYLVSGVFRKGQIFFKGYGGFMRKVLNAFDTIFVQNQASKDLLSTINVESVLSGDTRFDRVMSNAEKVIQYDDVKEFVGTKKVFILGSVWGDDLEAVMSSVNLLDKGWKVIIAPHEIKDEFIGQIESRIEKKYSRYSSLDVNSEVLIIDNIGMLMNLYQYADIAYVGGAFRTGLHNILEPAAFASPVIFGPLTDKFPEAKVFIEARIGFQISSETEFKEVFQRLISQDLKDHIWNFMNSQRGATQVILDSLD